MKISRILVLALTLQLLINFIPTNNFISHAQASDPSADVYIDAPFVQASYVGDSGAKGYDSQSITEDFNNQQQQSFGNVPSHCSTSLAKIGRAHV